MYLDVWNKQIHCGFTVVFLPAGLNILVKLYFPMETSDSERSFDINIACTELQDTYLYFDS